MTWIVSRWITLLSAVFRPSLECHRSSDLRHWFWFWIISDDTTVGSFHRPPSQKRRIVYFRSRNSTRAFSKSFERQFPKGPQIRFGLVGLWRCYLIIDFSRVFHWLALYGGFGSIEI